jgi:hypothetical protein
METKTTGLTARVRSRFIIYVFQQRGKLFEMGIKANVTLKSEISL